MTGTPTDSMPVGHIFFGAISTPGRPRKARGTGFGSSARRRTSSRAKAAAISPSSLEGGRTYGLRQNWWYDGRRDPMASTVAALDYLEALGRFYRRMDVAALTVQTA